MSFKKYSSWNWFIANTKQKPVFLLGNKEVKSGEGRGKQDTLILFF